MFEVIIGLLNILERYFIQLSSFFPRLPLAIIFIDGRYIDSDGSQH